jgi:hypothetical protein
MRAAMGIQPSRAVTAPTVWHLTSAMMAMLLVSSIFSKHAHGLYKTAIRAIDIAHCCTVWGWFSAVEE